MGKLNLTEAEKQQLKQIHKFTYNNSMRENRIRVILLYDNEKTREEIKDTFLIDYQTIRRYINDFKQYGMDSIDFEDGRKNKDSDKYKKLTTAQLKELEEYISNNIINNSAEIQDYIEEKYGVKYSSSGVLNILHELDFVYKKTTLIPNGNKHTNRIEKQIEFEQNYEKLKDELKEDDKIYFLDGVHPTHNTKADLAWIKKGQEKTIESNTGRERINLNGAYDLENTEIITLPSERVNSDSTILLFDKILENNDNKGDLYLISDNATYYKSYLIQDTLKLEKYKRIQMIFLPAYSPNLNPIEKLWKIFKKDVLSNKFYKTFKEFTAAVDDFFENKAKILKDKIKNWANDNFHIKFRNLVDKVIKNEGFKFNYFGR